MDLEEDIVKSIEIEMWACGSKPIDPRCSKPICVKTAASIWKATADGCRLYSTRQEGQIWLFDANGQGQNFRYPSITIWWESPIFSFLTFLETINEKWLRGLPQVLSVSMSLESEVYIMNRATNTEDLRKFCCVYWLRGGRVLFKPSNPASKEVGFQVPQRK